MLQMAIAANSAGEAAMDPRYRELKNQLAAAAPKPIQRPVYAAASGIAGSNTSIQQQSSNTLALTSEVLRKLAGGDGTPPLDASCYESEMPEDDFASNLPKTPHPHRFRRKTLAKNRLFEEDEETLEGDSESMSSIYFEKPKPKPLNAVHGGLMVSSAAIESTDKGVNKRRHTQF